LEADEKQEINKEMKNYEKTNLPGKEKIPSHQISTNNCCRTVHALN
jgi:hypothetical protein